MQTVIKRNLNVFVIGASLFQLVTLSAGTGHGSILHICRFICRFVHHQHGAKHKIIDESMSLQHIFLAVLDPQPKWTCSHPDRCNLGAVVRHRHRS